MKHNVFLSQVNYTYGRNAFLPYSVGLLEAYAKSFPEIMEAYTFLDLHYARQSVADVVKDLPELSVAGLSCYIWNWEYNQQLAQAIKQRWPRCVVMLGGPQVPTRSVGFFHQYPWIDLLVHYEGEETFVALLLELLQKNPEYTEIPGLSVRVDDTRCVSTVFRPRVQELDKLVSPYLSGIFDRLLKHPYDFHATQETHRGCPFSCTFCLSGESVVLTDIGALKIKDVVQEKIARKVWTRLGPKRITRYFEHQYSGDVVRIKLQGREPILCTPEHEWLTDRGWIPARNLGSEDSISVSLSGKESTLEQIDLCHLFPNLMVRGNLVKFVRGKKWVNRFIKVDAPFMRLCGLYLAEGHVSFCKSRPNSGVMVLTFGKHESALIAETIDLIHVCLGRIPFISETDTGIQIVLASTVHASLFKKFFGHGSLLKKIPLEWFDLSRELLFALVRGYLAGDGCFHMNSRNSRGRTPASTISQTWAIQIQLLLAKFGIKAGISVRKPGNVILGRTVCTHKSYRIEFPGSFIDHGDTEKWVRIVKIDSIPFSGSVFNVEVEEAHSFSVFGVESHNCDWGSSVFQKVRAFDMNRLIEEFHWFGEHQIELLYNADANYGMLVRDMNMTEALVATKHRYGFPKQFRAAYAKNSNDRVFSIAKMLNDEGMSKGVTLSFQSLNETTLATIKRKNIGIEAFTQLMGRYQQAAIPTYTELILGLPGETYDSFKQGLETLLVAGQHDSLQIYLCAALPNSEMSTTEYMLQHGIKTQRMPILLQHRTAGADLPTEYNDIVIETMTLSHEDWKRTYLLSWVVQAFHCLGLTQFIAIWLHEQHGCPYTSFYEAILGYAEARPRSWCGQQLQHVKNALLGALRGGSWDVVLPQFGDIVWPTEEATFLNAMGRHEQLCGEVWHVVENILNHPGDSALFEYQKLLIKNPWSHGEKTLKLDQNFHSFFRGIFEQNPVPLRKGRFIVCRDARAGFTGNLPEFAKQVVWYGRKGGTTKYTEVTEYEVL